VDVAFCPICHIEEVNAGGRFCSLFCLVEGVRVRTASKPKAKLSDRQVRRGWTYDALIEIGVMETLASGALPRKIGLEVLQARHPRRKKLNMEDVNRAVNAYAEDKSLSIEAEGWEVEPEHLAMLGPSDAAMRALLDADLEAFESALLDTVGSFCAFRDEFILDAKGNPKFINTLEHKEWIKETLRTIYTGGRLQLLVSPRMGKSYLMCDFSLWSICRNPEIAILWVGGSSDIAEAMVSTVRDHLGNNEPLRQAFLPPTVKWKPSGRGGGSTWTQSEFTVANRETIGLQSKTMTGIGKQSKILSRNVDILICDDIEDHDSTYTEGARDKQRKWFTTQVESRIEGNTATIMIGSRQNPLDMYGDHLEDESDLWNCLTYPAHDDGCDIDPFDIEAHTDCVMLFPIRDYRWLHEQKLSMESKGQGALFQMVYLNDPVPDGAVIFPPELIDKSLDPTRRFGLESVPTNAVLIGGLDPAAGGTQAAVVWAYVKPLQPYGNVFPMKFDRGKLWLVDVDQRTGTNVSSALQVMKEMLDKWNVQHWVIEANSFQQAIHDDREVKGWSRQHDVIIEAHKTTGQSKHHQEFGVAGIRSWFEDGAISLPYHPGQTKETMRILRKQFINYEGEAGAGKRKRGKDDALMAAWFPFKIFHKIRRDTPIRLVVAEESSYPGYDSNTSSWGGTDYPGRTAYPGT
jgi:hypothetical protein